MYSTLTRKTPLKAKTRLCAKTSLRSKQLRPCNNKPSTLKSKGSNKTKSVNRKTAFSIMTNNLNRCYITGDQIGVHIHHIFGGSNKKNSEKYGFIVPLRADWHNMADYGIHFNRELELKYKRFCQDYWLSHYGTKEDFILIFGKWW